MPASTCSRSRTARHGCSGSPSYAWPGHWDLVRSLTFGGASYLLLYQQKNGSLTICRIRADHTLEFVSEYSRTYGAKTTGFSTLGVYAHRGLVYVLGCSVDDGHAGIYQVIATEEIPATLTWQWNHQWAKGWTRFAFYNWGGENYFLKTNVAYKNVNIDHICDDASKGTHEVGSRLPLPLDLDFVEPLYVDHSPFFVAGRVTGELTFHRFHASGQGWSKEGEFVAIPGIRLLAPLIASEGSHLLVYGDSS